MRRVLMVTIAFEDSKIDHVETGSRILPAGEYEFRAGFSSRDVRATAVVSLA